MLRAHEPSPVLRIAASRVTPFLIVCDHAGNRLPDALGTLGLPPDALTRHIAWDIGIWPVAERLAAALGAPAIGQRYSRLAIDCNRAPGHPTSIPERSEATDIPGNAGLAQSARDARQRAIFDPYHAAIAGELDARDGAGEETILLALHSFTPVFLGVARPWHAGLLFNRHAQLGRAIAEALRAQGWCVGENEPYRLTDTSDYTVPFHAERRGLAYAEIEVRQDLIEDEMGQAAWAGRLEAAITRAVAQRHA